MPEDQSIMTKNNEHGPLFDEQEWKNPSITAINTLTTRQQLPRPSMRLEQWAFQLYESPHGKPTGEPVCVKVPSNWQLSLKDKPYGKAPHYTNKHYSFPYNPPQIPTEGNETGLYSTTFISPESTNRDRMILRFKGVSSAFYVWLNGRQLGYATDAYTAKEFDVTSYLKKVGELNQLQVKVLSWCAASYLEDQDMWRLSGLFRAVEIFREPVSGVFSLNYVADYDPKLQCGFFTITLNRYECVMKSCPNVLTLAFDLSYEGKTIGLERHSLDFGRQKKAYHFSQHVDAVKPWSAEQPHLYDLTVTLYDDQDNAIDVIKQTIGFKRVEIDSGQLRVNGKAIIIQGVNYHDACPANGRAISPEQVYQDLVLMKQNNVNAIRCSHYPKENHFYELCNQMGFYVFDEANCETHAAWEWYKDELMDDPHFEASVLYRVENMVRSNSNYVCIIAWSLGNEAGFGQSLVKAGDLVRSLDASRPIHYEGRHPYLKDNLPSFDFISNMYATPDEVKLLTEKDLFRPVILCEYAHAMGNSGGNLDAYDHLFRSNEYPRVQGGFVWEFADQGIDTVNDLGQPFVSYGSDWDQPQNDGNFCLDGLVNSHRRPSPTWTEFKKLWQPVRVSNIEKSQQSISFDISNRNYFKTLDYLYLKWSLEDARGQTLLRGQEKAFTVLPHSQINLTILLEKNIDAHPQDVWLNLSFSLKEDMSPLLQDQEMAKEQFLVHQAVRMKQRENTDRDIVLQKQSEVNFELIAGKTTLIFKEGLLEQYVVDGVVLIEKGPILNLWRAPTDNDGGWGGSFGESDPDLAVSCMLVDEWYQVGLDQLTLKVVQTSISQASFVTKVKTACRLDSPKGFEINYEIEYEFQSNGELTIHIHSQPINLPTLTSLPKLGSLLRLPKTMRDFGWYGRGPESSYCDRHQAQHVGYYENTIEDNHFAYGRPQENGNKFEVRSLQVSDANGSGLIVECLGSLLQVSVHRYSLETLTQARHEHELYDADYVTLNMDHQVMGVGGDNSWEQSVHEPYWVLPNKAYQFSYLIKPFTQRTPKET